MKKIILVFALLVSFAAVAQYDIPYKRPELLIGKDIVVRSVPHMMPYHKGYHHFYTDENMYETYKPYKKYGIATDTIALMKRHFTVTNVDSVKNIYSNSGYDKRLSLKSIEGEILYYNYSDALFDKFFPLDVVGGLDLPADYYCDYIKKNDKSEFEIKEMYNITATKTKKAGVAKYTFTYDLGFDGADPGLGMSVLLENGKKIDRPRTFVIIHGRTSTPHLLGSFELTQAEINLIKQFKVISVKLHKYTDEVTDDVAVEFRGAFNCLLTK